MPAHPFGTQQLAVERLPSPIRFTVRIKVEHYSCNFSSVRTLCVRVEHAQTRDGVFLVVDGQNGIGGRGVGDIWIKWRLFHRRSRKCSVRRGPTRDWYKHAPGLTIPLARKVWLKSPETKEAAN